MTLAFAKKEPARHSHNSCHPLQTGATFRGFPGSLSLRLVELLAPLADLTRHAARPTGTFTSELPAIRSPSSLSDITTVVSERFHWWVLHPLERKLASLHSFLIARNPFNHGLKMDSSERAFADSTRSELKDSP